MLDRIYDYDTFPCDPQIGDALNLCFSYDQKHGIALYDVNFHAGENIRLRCSSVNGQCANYQWRDGDRAIEIRLGPQIGDGPDGKIRCILYCEPHRQWEHSNA